MLTKDRAYYSPSPFRGNRFCIIFFESAKLYCMRESVLEYLNGKPGLNRLLRAVKEDCSNEKVVAGMRALGLCDKFLTGPIWRVIENDEVSVVDLPVFMRELTGALKDEVENGFECFMNGSFRPSERREWIVKMDGMMDELTKPCENDAETDCSECDCACDCEVVGEPQWPDDGSRARGDG
jgi:hypothetical protein